MAQPTFKWPFLFRPQTQPHYSPFLSSLPGHFHRNVKTGMTQERNFFIALIFPPSPHISLEGYAPFRVTSVLCKLIFIESANKFANLPQQSCPLKYLKCLNSSRIVVEIHVRFLVVCETVFLCRHTAAVRVSKRTKKST